MASDEELQHARERWDRANQIIGTIRDNFMPAAQEHLDAAKGLTTDDPELRGHLDEIQHVFNTIMEEQHGPVG